MAFSKLLPWSFPILNPVPFAVPRWFFSGFSQGLFIKSINNEPKFRT